MNSQGGQKAHALLLPCGGANCEVAHGEASEQSCERAREGGLGKEPDRRRKDKSVPQPAQTTVERIARPHATNLQL
eukprot:1116069-Pleurochrysis_carterae.AAC.2